MSYQRAATLALTVAAAMTTGALSAPTAAADLSTSSAFALSAKGLLAVDPTPNVTNAHGFAQDSVAEFSTPNRAVRAKVLNAQAGNNHAKASISDLTVDLNPIQGLNLGALRLTATAVEAVCHRGTGESSLAGARLGNQVLDVSAPANTTIQVPGLASVVLNKQTRHHDGSLTVTALALNLTATQTLNLASATCRATPNQEEPIPQPTPTIPGTPTTPSTPSAPASSTPNEDTPVPGQAPRPTPQPAHLDVTG